VCGDYLSGLRKACIILHRVVHFPGGRICFNLTISNCAKICWMYYFRLETTTGTLQARHYRHFCRLGCWSLHLISGRLTWIYITKCSSQLISELPPNIQFYKNCLNSHCDAVGIAVDYWLDDLRVWVRTPAGPKISTSPYRPYEFWGKNPAP
jgi:hypothetical protein